MKPPVQIGVDVGGTFTDLLARGSDGEVAVVKTRSTGGRGRIREHETVDADQAGSKPVDDAIADPSKGVLNAVAELTRREAVDVADVDRFVHSSTVCTNAVIEQTGAKTALFITEGYDAIPVVGTQARPEEYTLDPGFGEEDDPFLVPPRRTVEIPERVDAEGNVVRGLDE